MTKKPHETIHPDDPRFHFPKQVYHPGTAEMKVAKHASDVPDGWIDHYPTEAERAAASKPAPEKPSPLSRDQIIAALKEGRVKIPGNATTKELESLLDESLRSVIASRGAEPPIGASIVDLLKAVGSKVV